LGRCPIPRYDTHQFPNINLISPEDGSLYLRCSIF